MTLDTMVSAVLLDLLLQGPGPMEDVEVLGAAKSRAVAADGCELRSKLLQKLVCVKLFRLGYEYDEPVFLVPENEMHRALIISSTRKSFGVGRPALVLAQGESSIQ